MQGIYPLAPKTRKICWERSEMKNLSLLDKDYYLATIGVIRGRVELGNQKELQSRLECAVLPKKGRLSQADQERESTPEFVELRKQHSAVESAINALEVHGLDKCRDHGLKGFKRYIAMAVLARNIQRLGAVLRQQEQEAAERKRGPYKKAA